MTKYKKVKCLECNKSFYRITNTHLWKEHTMTIDDYKEKYPNAKIEDEELAKARVNNLKANQTYGAFNYRIRALEYHGEECMRCGKKEGLVVHDIDGYNDNSKFGNHKLDNLMILCRSCHGKLHNEKRRGKFTGIDLVEKGAIYMLKGLKKEFGLDISNYNFKDTPKRVARAYYEIFSGINANEELKNIAETSFPSEYGGMIISEGIKVYSMCPHHFLPVEYIVDVGYIPDKKTVGISKLARVVELLAKQPELQEMFTVQVAELLERELKPKGVIVQVRGKHFCMAMRGVKKDSWTMTSSIKGVFDKQKVREEFMLLTRRN